MPKTKDQKKKERERRVKAKMQRRRLAKAAADKVEREKQQEERKYQKLTNRAEGRTYVNRDPEQQHDMIQRNMDILQALEEQRKALEAAGENLPPLQETARANQFSKVIGPDFAAEPLPLNHEEQFTEVIKKATEAQRALKAEAEVVFTPKTGDTEPIAPPRPVHDAEEGELDCYGQPAGVEVLKDTLSLPEQALEELKQATDSAAGKIKRAWGKKKK